MEVVINNINPSGFGTVEGDGSYTSGDNVTITSTASLSYPFLKYVINGTTEVVANPYSFTAGAEDVEVVVYFNYSLINWLDSQIQFDLDNEVFIGVLVNRGISVDIQFVDATEKERDLAYADSLKAIISAYNEWAEKMQGWSSSRKMTYKDEIFRLMNSLYEKWGEPAIEDGFLTTVSNLW